MKPRRFVADNPNSNQYAGETYFVVGDYVQGTVTISESAVFIPRGVSQVVGFTPDGYIRIKHLQSGAILPARVEHGFGPNWFDHVDQWGNPIVLVPCKVKEPTA